MRRGKRKSERGFGSLLRLKDLSLLVVRHALWVRCAIIGCNSLVSLKLVVRLMIRRRKMKVEGGKR